MTSPLPASGVRLPYDQAPWHVRRWVERELGASVVEARDQVGGFSPGPAARVVAASGTRAFVKAVGPELNDRTPEIFRNELAAVRALPKLPWIPRLLAAYDDGDWIALMFEDVEGRQPNPWTQRDADLVFDAIGAMAQALTPSPWAEASRAHALDTNPSWKELAAEPPQDLPVWIRTHLSELVAMNEHAVEAMVGDTLVHSDIRADNLLITDDDRVVFVDWAWARHGVIWTDVVMTSLDLPCSGSTVDADALLARHPLTRQVDPYDITAAIASFAGLLELFSREPAPPGLPTIRAYQRGVADTLLAWTKQRMRW